MKKPLLLALLVIPAIATQAGTTDKDYADLIPPPAAARNLPFVPSLEVDKNPLCEDVLADVKSQFLSYGWMKNYLSRGVDGKIGPLQANARKQFIKSSKNIGPYGRYPRHSTFHYQGKTYDVLRRIHVGCGQACNRFETIVTAQGKTGDVEQPSGDNPGAADISIMHFSHDGQPWLFNGDSYSKLSVYELKADRWSLMCKINLDPQGHHGAESVLAKKALAQLHKLEESVLKILGPHNGGCGSAATRRRWSKNLRNNISMVVFNPWGMPYDRYRYLLPAKYFDKHYDMSTLRKKLDRSTLNGTFRHDMYRLHQWALTGIHQAQKLHDMEAKLRKSIHLVSIYYMDEFGWNKEDALRVAKMATRTAVSSAIRFYYYNPIQTKGERIFRKAIRSDADARQLEEIIKKYKDFDIQKNPEIIRMAVKNPSAVRVLLAHGIAPDYAIHEGMDNWYDVKGFDKTALMYAAQYNAYDSAKLLLEAGANPNARTITQPQFACYYDLHTFGMTPLYYAIRYSSKRFIKLLLDHGADPSIPVTMNKRRSTHGKLPVDLLIRYTDGKKEENLRLSSEDAAIVRKWLMVENDK